MAHVIKNSVGQQCNNFFIVSCKKAQDKWKKLKKKYKEVEDTNN